MRIGQKNKWRFVDDPCDFGNPLCTRATGGKREHFNPQATIEAVDYKTVKVYYRKSPK
jgi:hypothetical protein